MGISRSFDKESLLCILSITITAVCKELRACSTLLANFYLHDVSSRFRPSVCLSVSMLNLFRGKTQSGLVHHKNNSFGNHVPNTDDTDNRQTDRHTDGNVEKSLEK